MMILSADIATAIPPQTSDGQFAVRSSPKSPMRSFTAEAILACPGRVFVDGRTQGGFRVKGSSLHLVRDAFLMVTGK